MAARFWFVCHPNRKHLFNQADMLNKSYLVQVWAKVRNNIPRLILYAFAAGVAVVLAVALTKEDSESQKKMGQLRQMVAETPLLPGLRKHQTSEYSTNGKAIVIISYTSKASYEEVRDFYSKELVAKGWGTPVEDSGALFGFGSDTKSLTFRSGEFLIVIGEEKSAGFIFFYRWERQ